MRRVKPNLSALDQSPQSVSFQTRRTPQRLCVSNSECIPHPFQMDEALSDNIYNVSDNTYTTNTLGNNVTCDMPGQIPYMSWLILIMPLSTSTLNCAISFGKRRAGELFYSNRSA